MKFRALVLGGVIFVILGSVVGAIGDASALMVYGALFLLVTANLYALRQMVFVLFSGATGQTPDLRRFLFRRFVFLSAIKLSTFALLLAFIHWSASAVPHWVIATGVAAYVWLPFCYILAVGIEPSDR